MTADDRGRYLPGETAPTGGPGAKAGSGGVPIHAAGKLTFGRGASKGRDHWWGLLDRDVRKRIKDGCGRTLEWWATNVDGDPRRPFAVVFGQTGLAVAEVPAGPARARAATLQIWPFVPSSVKHKGINQRPQSRLAQAFRRSAGSVAESSGDGSGLGLDADTRGFLGNLPAEAQRLLQAPFVAGDQIQDWGYYYLGSGDQLSIWCYLRGSRAVTFASGTRTLPAGEAAFRAEWRLVCRQATIHVA